MHKKLNIRMNIMLFIINYKFGQNSQGEIYVFEIKLEVLIFSKYYLYKIFYIY